MGFNSAYKWLNCMPVLGSQSLQDISRSTSILVKRMPYLDINFETKARYCVALTLMWPVLIILCVLTVFI